MKHYLLTFLFAGITCLYSQSQYKVAEAIDSQSFLRDGEKKILACEGNSLFFTTGNSIGKLADESHLEAKYVAGAHNLSKEPVMGTFVTGSSVIQLSFSNKKLIKTYFDKDSLSVLKNEIIAEYDNMPYFKHAVGSSQNKEFHALAIMILDRNRQVLSIHLLSFDKDVNLLVNKEITYNKSNDITEIHNITVSNAGETILCLSGKNNLKENADEKLELAILGKNKELRHISIPLGNYHLIDYTAQYDPKGDIAVAGYFGEFQEVKVITVATDIKRISPSVATSVFTVIINNNTLKKSELNLLNFPETYKVIVPRIATNWQMYKSSVRAKEIIFTHENHSYLVGYEYLSVTSSDGYSNRVTSQYLHNALVTELDQDMRPAQLFFVEMSTNVNHRDITETPAFYALANNGNLQLLFIDHINNYKKPPYNYSRLLPLSSKRKKKEVLVLATIISGGIEYMTKQFIYNNATDHVGCLLTSSLYFDAESSRILGFLQDRWHVNNTKSIIEIPILSSSKIEYRK